MNKVFVVAMREYLSAVKSKAFIITIVAMPILMGGGIFVQTIAEKGKDTRDRKVAVIDRTGILYDALAESVAFRNEYAIFEQPKEGEKVDDADEQQSKDDGQDPTEEQPVKPPKVPRQVESRFILERVTPDNGDEMDLVFTLSERVRRGELFAFVDISEDVINVGADGQKASIEYYSNVLTYNALPRWLKGATVTAIREHRIRAAGLDPHKLNLIVGVPEVEFLDLVSRDQETGEITAADKVNREARMAGPLVMCMLMFLVIMVSATPLMQSTMEEKTQRIAEVVLSAITPFQWLLGKLIGMVGVSLTIVVVYFSGAAIYVLTQTEAWQYVPVNMVGWFALYQVLSILMFGALFIAVGSACTDHREAQSAVMPVMILIVLPMMFWGAAIQEPNGALATWLSFFPPATPILMLTRQALPPGVPAWQPFVAALLTLITTVAFIWAAGRIFRVGILAQGKGAGLKDMAKWLISG